MPPDDRANRRSQGVRVQRTGNPEGANQVIGSCFWLQLIQEPKSLLRKRSWESCWAHLFPLKLFVSATWRWPESVAQMGCRLPEKGWGDFAISRVHGGFPFPPPDGFEPPLPVIRESASLRPPDLSL